jgi:uncharacterized protein (TIGR04551 family)
MKKSYLKSCSTLSRSTLGSLLALGVLQTAHSVSAQPAGGGGGGFGGPGAGLGGPGRPAGQPEEEKKDGIAEAAAKTPTMLPSTAVLPTPKSHRKRWKLFELDGYYRMRSDWFKNFNLGFVDDAAKGGASFPRPLACIKDPTISACGNTMSGTNMRLRLEPTFNVDEGTSVHMQVDVLDNMVLGSTPTGEAIDGTTNADNPPPISAFSDSQGAPVRGYNTDRDAMIVKRVWAEVALPLGILKFGRMPNHWGMGIMANGGGEDPIHGTHDYDGDFGDNVDRVSFATQIPGTQLRAMIASDWNVTRLASNQTSLAGKGRQAHPFDLEDNDDANQWVVTIAKLDSPTEFNDTVNRGETALNYGVYFAYRTQDFDNNLTGSTIGGPITSDQFIARNAKLYIPSLWGRVAYGSHHLEGEFASRFGSVSVADNLGNLRSLDIRMFGGVGRYTWTALENRLKLGLEVGYASGDSTPNSPKGRTHIAYQQPLGSGGDNTITNFAFNRDYKVDLIMFRHLFGAVTNAVYGKPFVSYELTKSITAKLSNVTAGAPRANATPGNSNALGTEFDADIGYSNGGFSAGMSGGVLIPLAGLAHPDTASGTDIGYGSNIGDGGTAYTILARAMVTF